MLPRPLFVTTALRVVEWYKATKPHMLELLLYELGALDFPSVTRTIPNKLTHGQATPGPLGEAPAQRGTTNFSA